MSSESEGQARDCHVTDVGLFDLSAVRQADVDRFVREPFVVHGYSVPDEDGCGTRVGNSMCQGYLYCIFMM